MNAKKEFLKGLWDEVPVLRVMLGLCPTLAVSTQAQNGIAMGAAVIFVLLGSNIVVSLVRNFIPAKVRIPCYIVIIASFVTMTDMVIHALSPEIYEALGIFLPLITVNCLVLGRAEAFASKNTVWYSIVDALGMGLGFTIVLTALGVVRELIGTSGLIVFGATIIPTGMFPPALVMILPPGAFITLGAMLAVMNKINERSGRPAGG
jgi:electron transport complex protein RnfE